MRQIRIYVEGGGNKDSKGNLRTAFDRFFAALHEKAKARRIEIFVIPSGSRTDTLTSFRLSVRDRPGVLHLLLVDSERSVTGPPRHHLAQPGYDAWDLSNMTDEQCHLMVEAMESWFLADPEALAEVFGKGFATNALPRTRNVEQVPKSTVISSLAKAARNTSAKEYHKNRHSHLVLRRLDPAKVRKRAPHCERFFATVEQLLSPEDS